MCLSFWHLFLSQELDFCVPILAIITLIYTITIDWKEGSRAPCSILWLILVTGIFFFFFVNIKLSTNSQGLHSVHFCFWLLLPLRYLYFQVILSSPPKAWSQGGWSQKSLLQLTKMGKTTQCKTKLKKKISLSQGFEYLVNSREWSRDIGSGVVLSQECKQYKFEEWSFKFLKLPVLQLFSLLRSKCGQKDVNSELTLNEVFLLHVHLPCCLECTWSSSSPFESRDKCGGHLWGCWATRQEPSFLETLWSCHTSPGLLAYRLLLYIRIINLCLVRPVILEFSIIGS